MQTKQFRSNQATNNVIHPHLQKEFGKKKVKRYQGGRRVVVKPTPEKKNHTLLPLAGKDTKEGKRTTERTLSNVRKFSK